MIETKYNIGDTVYLAWTIKSITKNEIGIRYKLESDATEMTLTLSEGQVKDLECVTAEAYEHEINSLKDDVDRLRGMYQLEHIKVLKHKADFSHHPKKNVYTEIDQGLYDEKHLKGE